MRSEFPRGTPFVPGTSPCGHSASWVRRWALIRISRAFAICNSLTIRPDLPTSPAYCSSCPLRPRHLEGQLAGSLLGCGVAMAETPEQATHDVDVTHMTSSKHATTKPQTTK